MNKIVIAKPGFNALTETDPDNLIFSSEYDTLKYYVLGSIQMTVNYAEYYKSEDWGLGTKYFHYKVIEVVHNLGYIPFFIGYLMDYPASDNDVQLPIYAADFVNYASISCYADSNKLYFLYDDCIDGGNSGSTTFNLKYRIFKNDTGL